MAITNKKTSKMLLQKFFLLLSFYFLLSEPGNCNITGSTSWFVALDIQNENVAIVIFKALFFKALGENKICLYV